MYMYDVSDLQHAHTQALNTHKAPQAAAIAKHSRAGHYLPATQSGAAGCQRPVLLNQGLPAAL